jgi:oxidase EvaA
MIKSLVDNGDTFASVDDVSSWLQERNRSVCVNIESVPFKELDNWVILPDNSLRHCSGMFFSIEGIRVKTDYPSPVEWEQPIINQPEIGYLGILAKEFGGILHFLMQAKIEPGNVNNVQLSPTLQATKSNYTRVHGGRNSAYLDYFRNAKPEQIILDQLQSEQGARFLRKRNRNMIVRVEDDIPVYEDFRWLTLGQIKELMQRDNCVNMDTRTVLAGIDFAEYLVSEADLSEMSGFGRAMYESATALSGVKTLREVLSWLTNLKSRYDLSVERVPLNQIKEWECRDDEIVRYDKKYFRVLGVRVHIANREVVSWCQPLVQPMQQGICAFIIKKIGGIYHFLVQAKLECGNRDVFELAPTVQCLTGSIFNGAPRPPYTDYVLNAKKEQIIYDALQSEEGGRFYHEQNRNMIVVADDDFPMDLPHTYQWMTLGQINEFMRYSNYINIQARSLIAALKYK